MTRVTGIGGIFFTAKDPGSLKAWYKKHLEIDIQDWGGAAFMWDAENGKPSGGMTIWSVSPAGAESFKPGKAPFMINYRVADLHTLLAALREEGCNVIDKTEESEFGKFGWVLDPEENKIELWEPPPSE